MHRYVACTVSWALLLGIASVASADDLIAILSGSGSFYHGGDLASTQITATDSRFLTEYHAFPRCCPQPGQSFDPSTSIPMSNSGFHPLSQLYRGTTYSAWVTGSLTISADPIAVPTPSASDEGTFVSFTTQFRMTGTITAYATQDHSGAPLFSTAVTGYGWTTIGAYRIINGQYVDTNANQLFQFAPISPPPPDFNGDGSPDLVFQNDTTGQAVVWYLSGPPADALISWDWLATTGVTGWRLVSTADFNGDSRPDLVWQNDSTRQAVVWYMGGSQGNTFLGWDWLTTSGIDGWRLVTTGDFNGDGKPDLVWQNDATFQVVVWYLGGSTGNTFLGWDWLATSGIEGWRLVATGDFNGDGKPDLVWQNSARQALIWYMGGSQGNVFQSWTWLSASSQDGWTIVGTNNFNGDSKPDLVWQNDDTREVVVWYMGGSGGSVVLGRQSLASMGVAGWTAVAR